jgi:trans-2,3-dihydro-3-hydroxyanthranilate isomerase
MLDTGWRMLTIGYELCDVFAESPLAGNQLAVFTDASSIPEEMLQRLAREINYSEVAFLFPALGKASGRVRIFTPLQELLFAGHPVLGSAFVIAVSQSLTSLTLETGMGEVSVEFGGLSRHRGFGCMIQPVPDVRSYQHEAELLAALGVTGVALPVESYWNGANHTMVALSSAQHVAGLRPNLAALCELPATCVSCFAKTGDGWKTRVFSPADGVPEDPATGSAAGPLACHLVRHGWIGFGEQITIAQGAEIGRPGKLLARVQGRPGKIDRVEVCGSVIAIGRGELRFTEAQLA